MIILRKWWGNPAIQATKKFLFGYNPNAPFPVLKGNEQRGIVGGLLFKFKESVKAGLKFLLVAAALLVAGYLFAPELTLQLLSRWKDPVMRLHLRLAKAGAVEVREGLYVFFDQNLDPEVMDRVIATIRKEDTQVARVFGTNVPGPILIIVNSHARVGREKGTVILGSYLQGSHSMWGMHSINAVLGAVLEDRVVAHELTHMYVEHLNPGLNLYLNEGLAHFVQDCLYNPTLLKGSRIEECSYASARHWSSESPRSKSDSIPSRALGCVVVHYLNQIKNIPLKDIPLLADHQLPSVAEVNRHLRFLQLRLAQAKALARNPAQLDPALWMNAYRQRDSSRFDETFKSVREAQQGFQNLMDMSVQYLRWSGVPEIKISEMSPEEIMQVSEKAFGMIDQRLDDIGVQRGTVLFESLTDGIYDAGLRRLSSNSYTDTPEGRLERATDQGWARVYASKKLRKGEAALPAYSPELLKSIQQVTGPPSPARHLLHQWEQLGILDDRVNGS